MADDIDLDELAEKAKDVAEEEAMPTFDIQVDILGQPFHYRIERKTSKIPFVKPKAHVTVAPPGPHRSNRERTRVSASTDLGVAGERIWDITVEAMARTETNETPKTDFFAAVLAGMDAPESPDDDSGTGYDEEEIIDV